MSIPFVDLPAQHADQQDEYLRAIAEVVGSGHFAGGPAVERFEREFAAYCGTKFAIGVGSGTEALWLSLIAAGVGEGDEVITVANGFIATAEAIAFAKADPVLVDVDETTLTMDPQAFEAAISPRTKAVIPVHLYGGTADMEAIVKIARKHGIKVIEDAAQAHGARRGGTRTGNLGDIGCFSFYPGKNLGAFGDAGAVTTNDELLNERVRMLREHGQEEKNRHQMIGWNSRMDAIQGAVLSIKLRHLDDWNAHRRMIAEAYREALSATGRVILPAEREGEFHVQHVYAIRIPSRDRVMSQLASEGITTSIHYPVPIHLQEAFGHLGHGEGSFPVSEKAASMLLSLPIHPQMNAEQARNVAEMLKRALKVTAAA
ncbi:MAG: DegT/DnrJ/EryC1/StrS family aminotransferase [Verrucomicrobiota bacterium]